MNIANQVRYTTPLATTVPAGVHANLILRPRQPGETSLYRHNRLLRTVLPHGNHPIFHPSKAAATSVPARRS